VTVMERGGVEPGFVESNRNEVLAETVRVGGIFRGYIYVGGWWIGGWI